MVRDLNGNGTIDNGGELFGDQNVKADGTTATSGYEALGELDSNQDGKISSEDDEFDTLRVWQDINQDGISQSDELSSLNDAGIKSISLNSTEIGADDGNGNIIKKFRC